MEVDAAIARRRMTRSFDSRPLKPALLDSLLDAARRAPSAGLAQGVDLLVLGAARARERFWELNSSPEWREHGRQASGLLAAPVVVVPLVDPRAYVARYRQPDKAGSGLAGLAPPAWPVPYWLVDASFAVMNLLLAATSAEVGALFFRLRAEPTDFLAAFGAPPERLLIGAVALGYPAQQPPSVLAPPARRRRRPLAEFVHRDGW